MTFDQLEMLERIVEAGSFKAAAVTLHKSQPSLSVGIKKMEEEFGISLFDRSDYRPTLTEEGKIFFRWAKDTLESFRNLQVVGQEMGQKNFEPKITIVLDPLIQYQDIQGIFKSCLGPTSPTELTLRSEILDRGRELVIAGEAQFAICSLLENDERLETFPLGKVTMLPVASKMMAPEYKKFPQIIVMSSHTPLPLSKGPKCYVTDHGMKVKLITEGFGWGRLAQHEIEKQLKAKSLVKLPEKSLTVELFAMRNRHHVMGPLSKRLWQELKQRNF